MESIKMRPKKFENEKTDIKKSNNLVYKQMKILIIQKIKKCDKTKKSQKSREFKKFENLKQSEKSRK